MTSTKRTWQQIVDSANTKFDSLRLTKRWLPLENMKGNAAASGFAVQLEQITNQIKDL